MERESILFYRSFYEVSKSLPEDEGNKYLKGLLEYAFYGIEPEFDGVSASFFMLIRPQIDANNRKFENGKKGGRPKKGETDSVNGSEDEARPETEKTEETQINTEVIGDSKTEEKPKENQNETKTKPTFLKGFLFYSTWVPSQARASREAGLTSAPCRFRCSSVISRPSFSAASISENASSRSFSTPGKFRLGSI